MSITIELEPAVEAHLREDAERQGLSLSRYVQQTLSRLAAGPAASEAPGVAGLKTHSLLELAGVGAELWKDIEPQEYVSELRSEWDHRL